MTLKKGVPLHPLLLAAFPSIAIYVVNMDVVAIDELWRPLGISVGFATALYLLFSGIFRSFKKGAIFASASVALFFSFDAVSKRLGSDASLWVEVLVLAALAILLWRTRRDLARINQFTNFFSVVLVALSLLRVYSGGHNPAADQPTFAAPLKTRATAASVKSRPDIFFVVLDGHGRSDQIKRVMGVDTSGFVADLESKGFFVASGSHSNYCQTQLSLASTLNLRAIQELPKTYSLKSRDRFGLTRAADRSFAASYLRSLGYKYVGVTTGFESIKFDSADLVYAEPSRFTMLESAIVAHTPLPNVARPIKSQFDERRKVLHAGFDYLNRLATPTLTPRFVVAHIIAPHPPFVFDRNGGPVEQRPLFGFWDGSHFMNSYSTPEKYREGYGEQVQYIDKLVLKFAEEIGRKNPNAVVLVEGDHGSKLKLDQESLEKTDLKECFSNLIAIRAPEPVKRQLYPSMSSVNSLRLVFDGLFGEELGKLPDRSYYSTFSDPYNLIDITDKLTPEP